MTPQQIELVTTLISRARELAEPAKRPGRAHELRSVLGKLEALWRQVTKAQEERLWDQAHVTSIQELRLVDAGPPYRNETIS